MHFLYNNDRDAGSPAPKENQNSDTLQRREDAARKFANSDEQSATPAGGAKFSLNKLMSLMF